MSPRRILLPFLGFALLVLTGCASGALVDHDQPAYRDGPNAEIGPGEQLGQTFVARHSGLSGFEVYLVPPSDAPARLELHLRSDPLSGSDLATAILVLQQDSIPGFYRFRFPPRGDSHGEYYYAFLETSAAGINLPLAPGDAYLDGAAYQSHQPLDAQTSFQLVYERGYIAKELALATLSGAGLLAVGGVLFLLPGGALLVRFVPGRRWMWGELLGLSAGLSLALYPLLVLWTHLVGASLGSFNAWIPVATGLVVLLFCLRSWRPRQGWQTLKAWSKSEALLPDLSLVGVLVLVFAVRLITVRSLESPMWGDGYQHTVIAQLLVDNGGLFESWLPYATIDQFTYHFGFHSAVAAMHWITRMPVVDATVWTGQVLNGLAVLAVYPLAVRLTQNRWAGVWAVLLAGLLSPMPMFYVNWGRYTELAGLVILPTAVWLAWEAMDSPHRRWGLLVLAALAGAGLALTHYRVLLFYVLFVVALALAHGPSRGWRETAFRLGASGAGALLLFSPWLANAIGTQLLRVLGLQLSRAPDQANEFMREYNAIGTLDRYLSPLWWLLMGLGLGMGLWRRCRGVLLIGLWWLLLLLATNPGWLSLPGTGIISNFALFIAIYLPAGLLTSLVVVGAIEWLPKRWWISVATATAILGLGLWGTLERASDVDPTHHALLTRPDIRAASWLRENTPPDSYVLINSFSAYGGSAVVGSDGGWWLPLLSERQASVPPLNYANEWKPQDDPRQRVLNLAQHVQDYGLDDPSTLEILEQEGVTHVYVGQRQGQVNYSGEGTIQPEKLLASGRYDLVYHLDRVWILELLD